MFDASCVNSKILLTSVRVLAPAYLVSESSIRFALILKATLIYFLNHVVRLGQSTV